MNSIKKITIGIFALLTIVAPMYAVSSVTHAEGLKPPIEETEDFKCDKGSSIQQCVDKNPITQWLQFFINVISVVIVAGSAVMIAVGGLQYINSRDNPQAVQAAKQKIINVIVGLLFYFFLYAFLQWLVPGGIF